MVVVSYLYPEVKMFLYKVNLYESIRFASWIEQPILRDGMPIEHHSVSDFHIRHRVGIP
jgi:hypothetical protein